MAGRRIDGSSSMVALFENKGICTNGIEALLAPGSFADGFPGPQFMMNSDCTYNNSLKYDLEETADDDLDEHLQQPGKKRRLTANQVQFLEKNFELENKLEPERKFQLAKGLGLNPRQVSIWFQNRRARWKTKQLEKEYEYLKSSFVSLKVDHDNLLKENEKLQAEVVFLTSKLLHKENDHGSLESFELGKYPNELQNIDSPTITRLKRLDAQVMLCKQEDLSSANSCTVVLDLEDDGGYSKLMDQPTSPMNAFETNQSDLSSHIDEVLGCGFVRPENHSCNYAFQEEDHALWFWP